MTLQLE